MEAPLYWTDSLLHCSVYSSLLKFTNCSVQSMPPCTYAAGDLPLMWIRDSAVQINVLLPRIRKRPALRRPIEGAIRAQAFYILQARLAAVWLRVRMCCSAGAGVRSETFNLCVIG